ncbi:hypothetical protein BT93_L2789 [Corymbia citriodora subsp. variegata]|uniref:Uncharacterized protein n=1 Tax=Corymbia citriodora subsp. variegata TaxID=360336 RepID=A0A8T0CLE6_CORYI|nr:hypothetical protein BT93_L2789 [Corymbia citriodora subsp. variegata]
MNSEVAKIILESKEDIRNDIELFHLVKCYFNHAIQILDFYASLKKFLMCARDNHSRIQLALMHFEEERVENVGGEKYVKTLQDLQKFKEAGDPFTDEFSRCFHSVCKQQAEMFQKLQAHKKELDKKLKSAQTRRRATNAIFITTLVSALILTVVTVWKRWPPVVAALATAVAALIGTVEKKCDSSWKNYQKKLKGKKELMDLMNAGTKISINDLETIRLLVNKLETEIESILRNANFALGEEEEEAVKLEMLEIKKRVEVFMKTIEDLSRQAGKSSREIRMARAVISKRIIG